MDFTENTAIGFRRRIGHGLLFCLNFRIWRQLVIPMSTARPWACVAGIHAEHGAKPWLLC
jgi:hypothetical protein